MTLPLFPLQQNNKTTTTTNSNIPFTFYDYDNVSHLMISPFIFFHFLSFCLKKSNIIIHKENQQKTRERERETHSVITCIITSLDANFYDLCSRTNKYKITFQKKIASQAYNFMFFFHFNYTFYVFSLQLT